MTEKLDYVAMTILRGEIKSRVTVNIAERDICSMIQQSSYHLYLSLRSREHKSREPFLFVDNVRIGTSF